MWGGGRVIVLDPHAGGGVALSDLDPAEHEHAWAEIAEELRAFEGRGSFVGPCAKVVGVRTT